MKAEYKRDLRDNYLILSALEEKEEDDYSIYMVEKNKIPGCFRCIARVWTVHFC